MSQPQLFRQSYLNINGVSKDCYTFLRYLQEQKNLIGILTSMNITIFVDYLSKIKDPNDDKNSIVRLGAFMDFLHRNGKQQNNLIKALFDNDGRKLKNKDEICEPYSSIEEVKLNFESIESICDTRKPLFKVMSELVLDFSKREEVQHAMINITKKLTENSKESFTSSPCKYNNIYVTPHLARKLAEGNHSLETINSDPTDLPDNSKITSNATYKPTNLESTRIKTKQDKAIEEAIERELDKLIKEQDIDEYIEDELTSMLKRLHLGKGIKKTRKKRNKKLKKKLNKKTRKTRKKKGKIKF